MHFPFIRYRWVFYAFSLVLVLASILSMVVFGLNLGIEFTGGASLEVVYQGEPPELEEVRNALQEIALDQLVLQRIAESGLVVKTGPISQETRQQILKKLQNMGEIEEGSENFQLIGPSIGQELKSKTKIFVSLALLAILIYIALSFRKVTRPIKSYIYGLTSLIALFHDVLIPLGVFALLGKFSGLEISIPIITAFLTVFGYSINDSVVIFDRVRENIVKLKTSDFDSAVEQSLNQSLRRSLHTSLTTLFVLLAVFFFGGESLRPFSLALIIGILAGTYSSIFIATPLLVSYYRFRSKRMKRKF